MLDQLGYKISYSRVARSWRPGRRMSMKVISEELEDDRRISEMTGVSEDNVSALTFEFFQNQVPRDPDVPHHTAKMPEYE